MSDEIHSYTQEELLKISMEIILHAGNGRQIIQEAYDLARSCANWDVIDKKLKSAKEELNIAHRNQTEVIQNTITNLNQQFNFLFIHAQDTLMTINSELLITENVLKLHYSSKTQDI